MRPVRQRLAGLITVVALAGSPSVVAACAALCGSGVGHEQHHRAAAADVAQPAVEAAHHHHEDMAPAGAPVELMPAAENGASLSDASCCDHDGRALPSLAAAVRLDAGVAPAQTDGGVPLLSQPASGYLTAAQGASSPPSLVPRTLRVLRI